MTDLYNLPENCIPIYYFSNKRKLRFNFFIKYILNIINYYNYDIQ
jgi:hypothetical protein